MTTHNPSIWLGGETPRSTARDATELTSVGLGVKKTDREDLKTNDKNSYYKVREAAVEGMKNKFTLLKGINENATMEHLESVYSVITRFEDLKTQVIANDMLDVFSIPLLQHPMQPNLISLPMQTKPLSV